MSLNVLDFAAKGDGVTDDTAAFRDAMNAAKSVTTSPFDGLAHRQPVIVPTPGTYLLTAPLDVYPGFSMQSDCAAPIYQDDAHCPILWNKTGPMFRIPTGGTILDLSWSNLYMVGDRSAYQRAPYPGDVWLAHPAGTQIRGLSITGCRINAFNSLWGIPPSFATSTTTGRTGAVAGVHTGPPSIVMARITNNMLGSLGDWNDWSDVAGVVGDTTYPGGSARCAAWFVGSDSWIENNMFGGMGNGARHPKANRNIYVAGFALSASKVTGNHIVARAASHAVLQQCDSVTYVDNRHDPGFGDGADGCNVEVYNSKNLVVAGNWLLNGARRPPDPTHRAQLVLANVQNVEVGTNHFCDSGGGHIEVITNSALPYPTSTRQVVGVRIADQHAYRSTPPALVTPNVKWTAYGNGTFG